MNFVPRIPLTDKAIEAYALQGRYGKVIQARAEEVVAARKKKAHKTGIKPLPNFLTQFLNENPKARHQPRNK